MNGFKITPFKIARINCYKLDPLKSIDSNQITKGPFGFYRVIVIKVITVYIKVTGDSMKTLKKK